MWSIVDKDTSNLLPETQLEFAELVATASADFVSLDSDRIDSGVTKTLQSIGQFLSTDRCCVFVLTDNKQILINTHEWCAPGITSKIADNPARPIENLLWCRKRLYQREVIDISDILQLPADAFAEREFFQSRQTKSVLAIPMVYSDSPVGFLGLESVIQRRTWPECLVPLLKIVGDMFVSAFERNRAEQALDQSEERFQQVITSISDHVYFWKVTETKEHVNLYLSPNIEELTGYPYSQFAADWAFWNKHVIHPDDQPSAAHQAAKLASGKNSETEYRLVTADGSIIWVRDSGRTERVGGAILVYGVVADITERKHAEEALAAEKSLLAERVEERTAELSLANAELARTARLKDEFLASMSHELRTPLNAVLGMSEALQEQVYGPLNQEQVNALTRVEESGRHLLSLINDILDLSRIEAGKMELQYTPVDIFAVCHSSLNFVKKAAHDKHINVSSQIRSNITLLADERRLKQILINLLSNAVKFTPAGGKIGLEINKKSNQQAIEFSVWDTGIGIAEEDMGRLFKPFVQLDSRLSRKYEGTGLGLSLVYRMVEIHQGSVSVESEVGKGSRFTVSLPLQSRHHPVDLPPQDSLGIIKNPIKAVNASALILLAEDNESNIATISQYLQALGYGLIVARDGNEAIERVHESRPDLVLMDIQMPTLDGLEATRRIREDSAYQDLPIIALTALAMPGDKERCIAAGANDYISKPVSLRRLVTIIESFLS
jgi:PAS domain S-box-containing protein